MINSFSRRVRHYRSLRGMTQQQLALKANINFRHLQKIEGGKVNVKTETITKIAQALAIPDLLLSDHIPHQCRDHKDRRCCLEYGILELLPVGISIVDCTGLVIYTNRARGQTSGFAPIEVDGIRYSWEFAPTPEEQAKNREYLLEIVEKKPTPTPYRGTIRHRDGHIVNLKVNWRYLLDSKERVVGILSAVQEILDAEKK